MKTIKTTLFVVSMLLLIPNISLSQEQESFIMNLTEFTVKFGHDGKFTDGVKKWNKCYKDNNGTDTWNVWHRLQGTGNVYVLAGNMANWAEMDKEDSAGKACRAVALEFITPQVESTAFNMARSIPELSRKAPLGDMTIVWVTNFTVNDDAAFNDLIKDISSTMKSKEGANRGYWYRVMGGEGSDYFVSTPYKDFAALDVDEDGVWKVYESVHGKAKTKETRTKFRAAVGDIWSYTYTLSKDLSMQ